MKALSSLNSPLTEPISDTRMQILKKYFKPSLSPKPNSWIVDLASGAFNSYLFLINENARYLIVYAVANKPPQALAPAFQDFVNKYANQDLYLKSDGENLLELCL
jgi:hypothetical protein